MNRETTGHEGPAARIIGATPEALAAFAGPLPCRVIMGEEGPYLTRYTIAELANGGHLYLHRFHRGDHDRELHSHPWSGRSIILAGGYREERRIPNPCGDGWAVAVRDYVPGDVSTLDPDTYHRVDLLDPAAGCWTLFETTARVQSWGFWCRDTGRVTPWREMFARRGLGGES